MGFNPEFFQALVTLDPNADEGDVRSCRIDDLSPEMIIQQEVRNVDGGLLVSKGHEVTPAVIVRLKTSTPGDFRIGDRLDAQKHAGLCEGRVLSHRYSAFETTPVLRSLILRKPQRQQGCFPTSSKLSACGGLLLSPSSRSVRSVHVPNPISVGRESWGGTVGENTAPTRSAAQEKHFLGYRLRSR